MEDTEKGRDEEDPGEWTEVKKGKGAKPREPTLFEKALNLYSSTLSGSRGGSNH